MLKYTSPPGCLSKLNCQSTRSCEKCFLNLGFSVTCLMCLAAELKVLPLSEITLDSRSRLDAKLLMVSAVILVTRSRCTTLVAQRVYRHSQTFNVPYCIRCLHKEGTREVHSGDLEWPGLLGSILRYRGSGGLPQQGLPSIFLQTVQQWIIFRTNRRPLASRYSDQSLVSLSMTPLQYMQTSICHNEFCEVVLLFSNIGVLG